MKTLVSKLKSGEKFKHEVNTYTFVGSAQDLGLLKDGFFPNGSDIYFAIGESRAIDGICRPLIKFVGHVEVEVENLIKLVDLKPGQKFRYDKSWGEFTLRREEFKGVFTVLEYQKRIQFETDFDHLKKTKYIPVLTESGKLQIIGPVSPHDTSTVELVEG